MWLKCYVGLLAVSCVHFTKAVEIAPYLPVFSVAEGSYLELNCTSRGSIQWSANVSGVTLHIGSFVTANGENGKRLVFHNVTRANAMTYTCQRHHGLNPASDQASFELRVFTVTRQDAVFMDNHNATLSCHVEDPGTYTYIWKKGETFVSDIPVEGKQAFVSDSNGTLEIRHPDRSAAGQFTCIAVYRRHDEGEISSVTYPADFKQNDSKIFNCSQVVSGQLHIYNWKKDNTPISDIPLKENQAFITHSDGTLEIRNADPSLSGHYSCTAFYVQPYAIETKVNYNAKPKVVSLDKSKMENGNQVLVCNVLGYPEPIITWWKGRNRIKGGDNSDYKLSAAVYNGMTVNDAKLEIQGVVSEDGEDYKCMAQNSMWPGFNSTSTIHVSDAFSHVHTGPLTTFIGLCVVLSMMLM